ncbi:hypothetical protein [Micromonospora cremea]|uniref:Uncharacterized protein n=1 Tax=Micromonospora cremea TaxID=709881 RepID=A0A1N5VAE3_9ACTN|nr:hypothetical protein [Micromonospora cremea]SIM69736.1 hypothetical protein SAMN04489832_1476 [Micromonospora cremea]
MQVISAARQESIFPFTGLQPASSGGTLGGAPGSGLSIAVSNPTTPGSGATGSAGTV